MKRIISLMLCIILAAGAALSFTSCKSNDYKKACELLEAGEFEQAKAIFEALGDYKDSKDYLGGFHYIVTLLHAESEDGTARMELTLNESSLPSLVKWYMTEELGSTEYFYDEKLNIVKLIEIDEEGVQTVSEYTYDENNVLTKETKLYYNGSHSVYEYTYDENGNCTLETLSGSSGITSTISYSYNAEGRLIKKISALTEDFKIITEYAYDEKGNEIVKSFTTADGSQYANRYEYDENGNLIKVVYGSSSGEETVTNFTYDEKGNKLSEFSGSGDTLDIFNYTYDAYGNLITRTHTAPDGVWENLRFEYALVYIPIELPQDTLDELKYLTEY